MDNGLPKESKVGEVKAKFGRRMKASSTPSREGNVCNDALHVIGLHWHGNKISLSLKI